MLGSKRWDSARIVAGALLVLSVAGCTGGSSGEKSSDAGPKPASAADRKAISAAVGALDPSSGVGFAPEVFEQVSDPAQILPVGATVRVVDDTFIVEGDRATVDAVVSVPGAADAKYWLFLERRDGAWLVAGTLELGE
ncbi:MAG: hypothetical protein RL219_1204 [Actinomycetota bacterium]